MTSTANGALKRSPRATMAHRGAANSRSQTFCPLSSTPECAIPFGSADVHYTAAHYYDPNKAAFQDFEPFWEFVSGPIHAGTFGPNQLDATFGPQVVFMKAPSKEQGQNLPPSEGMQFFGNIAIDGASEVMTVTLKDVDDRALWSTKIEPKSG